MAVYTGKVNLINMSNITATAGVGIQSTRILYATSDSGAVPPDLDGVELKTNEDEILDFASTGSSFHVIDGIIWAQRGESQVALQVSSGIITGFSNWETTVPTVQPGSYLWSKTIYTYTDGKKTVTYAVSYQGADGEPGPAGASSSSFKLICNQTEVLKFIDSSGNTSISPANLRITIQKEDPYHGSSILTNLDYSKFSLKIYNPNTGQWYDVVDNENITLEATNNFNINLSGLIDKGGADVAASQLASNECILKVEYILILKNDEDENEQYELTDFLNVRYGMNRDMAALNVKANGIVASMQESKLNFDAAGLTIQNGAFIIQDKNGEDLLYSENGNLAIKGTIYADNGYFRGELQGATGTFTGSLEAASGTFTGTLQAASGSFSGEISASGGSIGGFIINSTHLVSSNKLDNGMPSIVLNGTDGTIEAENITLGTGAKIKEYIKIGQQVELRNVKSSTDSFIKVENEDQVEILSLKANGTMRIGDGTNAIILSGNDGSISSQNYADGLGWKISNTNSIFNDVTVRGSIRASVLEYGETQAIGGALLVRPSSRILDVIPSADGTILILEEIMGFNEGDSCRLDIMIDNKIGPEFYEIVAIDRTNKRVQLNEQVLNASAQIGKPIVSFGQVGDNVGISINGSSDKTFCTPQSISVFEFNKDTHTPIPRIILGKMPNDVSIYGQIANTYGLYAENVLLKGSLVTQSKTEKGEKLVYSGISTVYNGTEIPHAGNSEAGEKFSNPGEILLWAGASDNTAEAIQKSNFFVDRNGNLFAGSGYFKGTIITDATITASAIETAILRGSNTELGKPALSIEDATKGIVFTAKKENGESEVVFEVTKNSITANVPNFKFNSNFTVGGNGSLVVPNLYVIGNDTGAVISDEVVTEAIMFDKKRISYTRDFKQNELSGGVKGYIDFSEGIKFSPDGNTQVLTLAAQQVQMEVPLYIKETVKYNDIMEYKPAYSNGELIGYDLYVE